MFHNGIVFPDKWPPSDESDPRKPPPYLESPPEVIPIDVGRQLFVDDFLVESTTLTRTFHLATYCEGNPVLKPDRPWELLREDGYGPVVWWKVPANGLSSSDLRELACAGVKLASIICCI